MQSMMMQRRLVYKNRGKLGKKPKRYFAYLEARDPDVSPPAISADSGWPIGFAWPAAGVSYLGFSIVDAKEFNTAAGKVSKRPARGGDSSWRAGRRDQLRALFETVRPRRLEIYPSIDAPDVESLRRAFRLGGWFHLVLRPVNADDDPAAGLLAVGDDEQTSAVSLARMSRIDPVELTLLRSVFSLDHIADVGENDEGPTGEPDPDPPVTPPLFAVIEGWGGRDITVVGAHRLPSHGPIRNAHPQDELTAVQELIWLGEAE